MVAGSSEAKSSILNMSRTSGFALSLMVALVIGIGPRSYGASLADTLVWKDAGGNAVSFQSLDQVEEFLLTADVDSVKRAMEVQAMQLFDSLIYNEDRNLGNVLIDPDRDIWMIDHTRAFRVYDEPANLDQVQCVEKGVWNRLNTVSDQEISDTLAPYLGDPQIRTLLQRRARIVEHLANLIQEKGECRVLYSIWPDRGDSATITLVANPE